MGVLSMLWFIDSRGARTLEYILKESKEHKNSEIFILFDLILRLLEAL